jgi:UDP-3-O-[3-hydroxymyristoyl] N-acetylglucosamine deacetylase/3-hydroxyacyl-[acyl-carrier-protein] dehydratase
MVGEAGLAPQGEARETWGVTTPMELQTDDSLMSIFPHDRLKISCTSADKAGRFSQFFSIEVTPDSWEREIAHARTFCFFEEIEYLIKNGLIKGGSLENAVVIRDDAVLTTEPLRYNEEFVRHKILDIIGDLSLLGRPLRGHIIAMRPSHTLNCELARSIQARMRRPLEAIQTFTPPPPALEHKLSGKPAADEIIRMMSDGSTLDIAQVMKILPHRFPFLLVDKVTKIQGNEITAVKNVTINEPFFQGHFPGHPIMPGVLIIEAMAQVGGMLLLGTIEDPDQKVVYFMSLDNVKFRRPVLPGDQLRCELEMLQNRGRTCRMKGIAYVDGNVVCEAEMMARVVDR